MGVNEETKCIGYAILSYVMWGLTPVYWKVLQDIPAEEILSQRVFWSFVFMVLVLIVTQKWSLFIDFTKKIFKQPRLLGALVIASVLISSNWGIFMWAVLDGKILEASLGQYINPLTSMLLGVILLKERLTALQILAFLLAGIGVGIVAFQVGVFPWISLSLALTFGFYSLAKKIIKVDASLGLAMETMVISPLSLVYLSHLMAESRLQFADSLSTSLLLMGSGAVTALPLLLFTKSAKKVSLSMLGILQYISPTLSLLVGVLLYHETLTEAHIIAFIFIWVGLAIYSVASRRSI